MATATDASARPGGANLPNAGQGVSRAMSSDFLSGFMRLDFLRQLGLMTGLAASVAIGFAVVLWSRGENYQPLYADMNGYDISALVEVLETRNLDFRIEPSTGVILVPAGRVSELRLQVAAAGISRESGYGYESLDAEQGLGTSQFMEANRYKRSQEGELQRTIMGFRNVQSARVHLATPERSVFVRSSRKPTASVFLTLQAGSDLSDTQVDAISNLVASSVPELTPENVTVVDQRGNLLSRKDDTSDLVIAGQQFDYSRRYEDTLVERLNRILQPIVGVGRFSAEISADIDFTRTEQAAEVYSPEGALRSEQSSAENRPLDGAAEAGGIPGALSNQPPVDGAIADAAAAAAAIADPVAAAAAAAAAINGNSRQQSTRNFELDRTISYTSNDPVAVRRLSVAVVLDDRPSATPAVDGTQTLEAWAPEDIERITALVRDVVGYSAERGDSVTVINNRFAPVVFEEFESQPFWQQDWLISGLKQALGFLLVGLLVLGVLRPVLRNLSGSGGTGKDLAKAAAQGEYADLDINGDKVTLSGSEDMMLPGPTDGYERQLNAIKGLIAQDPGRVAQVVKQWISDDA